MAVFIPTIPVLELKTEVIEYESTSPRSRLSEFADHSLFKMHTTWSKSTKFNDENSFCHTGADGCRADDKSTTMLILMP